MRNRLGSPNSEGIEPQLLQQQQLQEQRPACKVSCVVGIVLGVPAVAVYYLLFLALVIAVLLPMFIIGAVIRFCTWLCFRQAPVEQPPAERYPSSKAVDGHVWNIAHRGGRELQPENTLASFKHAMGDGGADMLELDVWLTSDGRVAVFHDGSFKRMCGGHHPGHITKTNFADCPSITMARTEVWEHGRQTIGKTECYQGLGLIGDDTQIQARIPLLSEVFDAMPDGGMPVIIEFKQESDELIENVLTLVQERKLMDYVIWFSLEDSINRKLRRACPDLPNITSVGEIGTIWFLHYMGLLRFHRVPAVVYGFFAEMRINPGEVKAKVALFRSLPIWLVRGILLPVRLLNAMLLSNRLHTELRRRNVLIWALGVNTDAQLAISRRYQADAVITDRPQWLSQVSLESCPTPSAGLSSR